MGLYANGKFVYDGKVVAMLKGPPRKTPEEIKAEQEGKKAPGDSAASSSSSSSSSSGGASNNILASVTAAGAGADLIGLEDDNDDDEDSKIKKPLCNRKHQLREVPSRFYCMSCYSYLLQRIPSRATFASRACAEVLRQKFEEAQPGRKRTKKDPTVPSQRRRRVATAMMSDDDDDDDDERRRRRSLRFGRRRNRRRGVQKDQRGEERAAQEEGGRSREEKSGRGKEGLTSGAFAGGVRAGGADASLWQG